MYYDRIDASEGTDPAKSNGSKECIMTHLWDYCFINHRFKFQDSVCNGCHDLTIFYLNISNIAIINVKNIDYHCIIQAFQ